VAILGSPNVGKSTLFNRLLNTRRAITHSTPGVTRDTVEAVCRVDDIPFLLIDTGGFQAGKDEPLDVLITQRSLRAAQEATLILLLVDAGQLTGNDMGFIERLRPHEDKLVLVVNKVDDSSKEPLVWDYLRLGFKRVIGISAAHGRNLEQLRETVAEALRTAHGTHGDESVKDGQSISITVLGKPNTGKSTLCNRLIGQERSIVTSKPGTTRDVIQGRFSHRGLVFELFDTAGIRKKKKVASSVEYYSVNRAIQSIDYSDVVFLLIDAFSDLTEQDKRIASLAVKEGRGIILAVNKWDLVRDVPNRLRAAKDRIAFLFPALSFAPVVAISAKTGYGIDKLLNAAARVRNQLNRRVPTPTVNRLLEAWRRDYPSGDMKIRYATQISINPVVFLFFVANRSGAPEAFSRYLANRIRRDLGFDLIPVIVRFRGSRPRDR
jgi:GTP-binding protein